jgi:hypothetical protein
MTQIFSGSSLLVIEGIGHISYSANPDLSCAKTWIEPYFRNGALPQSGTMCPGNQEFFPSTIEGAA